MKILLIGEYSRLHNSLKEGLVALGHDVVIIGSGDAFKKYPVDVYFKQPYTTGFSLIFKKIVYKCFGIDLTSIAIKKQFDSKKHDLIDFDVVQLINENAFNTIPKIEHQLLDYIFKNNKRVFLLSCGADYSSVAFSMNKGFRYSILNPYFENRASKKDFWHIIKYATEPYKKLHHFIIKNIKGVIASDLDYDLPLINNTDYLGMIPNPINTDEIEYTPLSISDKIVIFHGVNTKNYIKKGNQFFDEALEIINAKYSDKIRIIRTKDLTYSKYISAFNEAHIVLDQVYAYDQGYNALEAMAKGKVVFTGAEQEWLDYYKLKIDTVAINALPNTEAIAEKLSWLIENPTHILEISQNARTFLEKEHNYITIAKRYLETWQSKSN